MEIKKYLKITNLVFFILSLVLLGLAVYAWGKLIYTGIIFSTIGLLVLVISGSVFIRLRTEDLDRIGEAGIQHAWGVTSIGLVGASLFLAPFFDIENPTVPYVAFTISIIFMVIGIANLYKTRKDTDQFLSI